METMQPGNIHDLNKLSPEIQKIIKEHGPKEAPRQKRIMVERTPEQQAAFIASIFEENEKQKAKAKTAIMEARPAPRPNTKSAKPNENSIKTMVVPAAKVEDTDTIWKRINRIWR